MLELKLSYNELQTRYLAVESMTKLQELHLTSNRLVGIPHTFGVLKELRCESISSLSLLSLSIETPSHFRVCPHATVRQSRDFRQTPKTQMQRLFLRLSSQNSNPLGVCCDIPKFSESLSLLCYRAFFIGCNDFPVDAHQQYLKTHEQAQAWLSLNMQYWAETQARAEKDSKKKRRKGLPG